MRLLGLLHVHDPAGMYCVIRAFGAKTKKLKFPMSFSSFFLEKKTRPFSLGLIIDETIGPS